MKFHLDYYLDERETSDSRGGEEKRSENPRVWILCPDKAAQFNVNVHTPVQTCLDDDRPCLQAH